MSLFAIATEYNGPPEAAHGYSDDERYDMIGYSAAVQPKLDLSDQLQHCSVAST